MRTIAIAILSAFVAVAATPAVAAKPEVYTKRFSNLAVDGFDPVAYFTVGEPVKGVAEFSTDYKGATWRFSSADNLAAFLADPAAYAPQYGGYCAWAVANNYTARGNPKNWAVRNGKLYLNYNDDVQQDWLVDPDGFIAKADANWPAVLSK